MTIIPDASVLLRLVLQETSDADNDGAIRFIHAYQNEQFDVLLPTLWRYEIGNVLDLKVSATAKEGMAALLAFQFPEAPLDYDYAMGVLDFMREIKGITFYDAAYHVLALRTSGTLLTADARYVKKASGKRHMALLSDWAA